MERCPPAHKTRRRSPHPGRFLASNTPPDVPKDHHQSREFVGQRDLGAQPIGFIESKLDAVVSHRWMLTLAIGLAFVICDMDKVRLRCDKDSEKV